MWKSSLEMLGPALVTAALVAVFIVCEYGGKRWFRRQFRGRFRAGELSASPPEGGEASWWRRLFVADPASASEETATPGARADDFVSLEHYFGQRFRRYGFAVLAVSLALLVRWLLDPVLKGAAPYSFFLVAAVVTAWNCGVWETLLTVVLGFLAGTWFFVEPFSSFAISDADDRWSAVLYLFIGLSIVAFKKSIEVAWSRALNKDIESLKRREKLEQEEASFEETRVASELLASVVETSQDSIFTITPKGLLVSWNRAAEKLLGFSAREAIGQSLAMIVPTGHRAEEERILEQVSRGERTERWQTALKCKSGANLEVSLNLSPVKDRAGKLVGAFVIVRDRPLKP